MADRRLIRFARELRRKSTDAERRMWSYLRKQRLGGHIFRRQHPIGPYIADFYCHAAGLIVELDGGQHSDPDAAQYDADRTAFLVGQGLRVIRFWDHEALKESEAVARTILREVEDRLAELRRGGPHPNPPPAYRERGSEDPSPSP